MQVRPERHGKRGLRDADARAGRRFAVAGLGLVLLVLAVGPLALLVHGRWAPLQQLDDAVSDAAERLVTDSPALLTAARLVTHLGDPLLVTLGSVLVAAALWATGHRRTALFVLVARVGALVLSTGLKQVVGRARPVFDTPVASELGLSFPSGHALGGSAFWLAVAVAAVSVTRGRRAWLALAIAVSLLVAASRVLIGVHYASDVVAGLVLGAGWTAVCTALFVQWYEEESGWDEQGRGRHEQERGRAVPYEQALDPERAP